MPPQKWFCFAPEEQHFIASDFNGISLRRSDMWHGKFTAITCSRLHRLVYLGPALRQGNASVLFIVEILSILSKVSSTAGEEDFRFVDLGAVAVCAAHELHQFSIIIPGCDLIARELGRTRGAV